MVLQKKKLNLGIDSSTILDTYRHILEPNDIDIEFLYGGRDSATFVSDVPKFIDTHISFLERNSGNKTFKPYYNRLIKLLLYL